MNAVDLFAGAGGWSHGWRMATETEPIVAVNHCAHAIQLHKLNHPSTEHFPTDIWSLEPKSVIRGRKIEWLHGSPDCTHFSRAKGGKPKSQKIRALAWVVYRWVKEARPSILSLENVAEFLDWGPLDSEGQPNKEKKGASFRAFVASLQNLGYKVDWRVLCAADYGTPTVRKRLFLLARCDGQPIEWPEPTHGEGREHPWRTAAECIDWSIPCKSIFGRKKELAPATQRRIAAGIVRYVLNGTPYITQMPSSGNQQPEKVAAFLQQNFTGMIGKPMTVPVPTITSIDHHSLVAASLVQSGYGERLGQAPRALDIERPLGTVVSGGSKHALVAAFLTTYYGEGGGTANPVDRPMPAVVTKGRHGLVTYSIGDIGLRMLEPRELARAQGFPDSYKLEGTKTQQIARIGNSVCPQVVEALVRANTQQEMAVA
jgi:DNA (cytosine-5)-methyltransferase 1